MNAMNNSAAPLRADSGRTQESPRGFCYGKQAKPDYEAWPGHNDAGICITRKEYSRISFIHSFCIFYFARRRHRKLWKRWRDCCSHGSLYSLHLVICFSVRARSRFTYFCPYKTSCLPLSAPTHEGVSVFTGYTCHLSRAAVFSCFTFPPEPREMTGMAECEHAGRGFLFICFPFFSSNMCVWEVIRAKLWEEDDTYSEQY